MVYVPLVSNRVERRTVFGMEWREPEGFVSTPLLGRVFCADYEDEQGERTISVNQHVSEAGAVVTEEMMAWMAGVLEGEVDA